MINFREVRFRAMGSRTRGIRIISSVAALCVLAAAGEALAEDAGDDAALDQPAATELAGRWEGASFALGRAASDCGDRNCTLVLDLAPCQSGWCGVEVKANATCGATALKLNAGEAGNGNVQFKGKLELAHGTEPYVVEVYLRHDDGPSKSVIEIIGDTGGEFRMFRRTFPFNATLARTGDAKCRPEGAVSLLD
jgi:hypothetical protein